MLRQKITPTQQNHASVHTTTTTTDTRSNNANTSTQSNICEKSVYYGTMILIHENKKNKTTRIECLTANGSEKEKVMDQFLDSRTHCVTDRKKCEKCN